MEAIKLTAPIHKIGETQQITDKFKKRDVILYVENTNKPEYSDYIKLEAMQDKCETLDSLKPGDVIEATFFLSGRKVDKDGKELYFTSLKLHNFSIQTQEQGASAPPPQQEQPTAQPPQSEDQPASEEEDDLPF